MWSPPDELRCVIPGGLTFRRISLLQMWGDPPLEAWNSVPDATFTTDL